MDKMNEKEISFVIKDASKLNLTSRFLPGRKIHKFSRDNQTPSHTSVLSKKTFDI